MKLEADIMHNAHTANLFKQLEILPLEQLILFTKLNFMYDYPAPPQMHTCGGLISKIF